MDSNEQLIADSLSKHAADAPSNDHLLEAVHARLHRRRTARALGAIVVAAAAVATAITASHNLPTELHTDPQIAQQPAPGWRWESYKTVQVQVPSSWTQYISGPAPCTPSASASAPVVGRFNDWLGKYGYTCEDAVLPLDRRLPYLWFNDVQAPGIKQYDGGWSEETRIVGGTKVSVLTNNEALRRRIVDSARPITGTDYYGCTPTESLASGTPVNAEVTSAGVCEYYKGTLVAGSRLSTPQVTQLARLLRTAPTGRPVAPPPGCQDTSPRTYVVTLHTRSASWPVRIMYSTCDVSYKFATDDGKTQRLVGYPVIDLLRTGVHKPNQPSDLFDPAHPLTPSPR
jgi:hypothetical protein